MAITVYTVSYMTPYQSAILSITLACTVFKTTDTKEYCDRKI